MLHSISPCLHQPAGALPLPASRVRRTTRFGGSDAASAHRGPVDLGRRLRQARRGGARRRCGGCGLDPCRRHGRALRAQHLDRSRRGEGAAPAHPEGARCASDDRALRSLSRSLRQGRRRHHHGSRGSGTARAPFAADDPRARQEGRRDAQPRHAGEHDRAGHRSRRSHPGDVGQSRLRRPELHPVRRREDFAPARARGRAPHRHRGRRRHYRGRPPRSSRGPGANVLVAGSAVFKGGKPDIYRANIAAIRNAAALARGEAA